MFDRVDLKRRAKEYAFNHKWDIWKGFLLAMVVSFAASMVAYVVSQIFVTNIKGTAGVLIGSLITFAFSPWLPRLLSLRPRRRVFLSTHSPFPNIHFSL